MCQKMPDYNFGPTHYCHDASQTSFHPSCIANICKNYIQKLHTENCIFKIGLLQLKLLKWRSQKLKSFLKARPHNHLSENQKKYPAPKFQLGSWMISCLAGLSIHLLPATSVVTINSHEELWEPAAEKNNNKNETNQKTKLNARPGREPSGSLAW